MTSDPPFEKHCSNPTGSRIPTSNSYSKSRNWCCYQGLTVRASAHNACALCAALTPSQETFHFCQSCTNSGKTGFVPESLLYILFEQTRNYSPVPTPQTNLKNTLLAVRYRKVVLDNRQSEIQISHCNYPPPHNQKTPKHPFYSSVIVGLHGPNCT